MDRDVFTFSEWAEGYSSKDQVTDIGDKTTNARQTWTVEVPFERPNLHAEHPKTSAEEIRKKRIQSGVTQKALGVLLNVAECTVYSWERGIRPKARLRHRVGAFFSAGNPCLRIIEPGS